MYKEDCYSHLCSYSFSYFGVYIDLLRCVFNGVYGFVNIHVVAQMFVHLLVHMVTQLCAYFVVDV